jgi:flagellar biosynthesis protein FliQ
MMQLAIEAMAVGAMLALSLLVIHLIVGPLKTMSAVLLTGFVVGIGIHVLCEVTRINSWYCTYGRACQK